MQGTFTWSLNEERNYSVSAGDTQIGYVYSISDTEEPAEWIFEAGEDVGISNFDIPDQLTDIEAMQAYVNQELSSAMWPLLHNTVDDFKAVYGQPATLNNPNLLDDVHQVIKWLLAAVDNGDIIIPRESDDGLITDMIMTARQCNAELTEMFPNN